MSYESANTAFSVCSFIGFLFCTIPLYWHLESWNTGTCLYMAWTALANLNLFINSIVWRGNAINWNPIWCDVSTKFMIGSAVAIPAASLCINRRLYHIAAVKVVRPTKADRLKAVYIDLAIGLGIPLLEMILHYIVQGHRFNIYEDIGCFPDTFNSIPSYFLVFAWPIAIGCVSAVYCVLTLRHFLIRRKTFNEFLSSNSNLTYSRYFRLMALAGIEILSTLPLGIWSLYINSHAEPVLPWVNWENVHVDFSRVEQIPTIFWTSSPLVVAGVQSSRWLVFVCACIFFIFFGFADEAIKHYKIVMLFFLRPFGVNSIHFGFTRASGSSGTASSSLPAFHAGAQQVSFPKPTLNSLSTGGRRGKHDPLDSIDALTSTISVGKLSNDDKYDEKADGHSSYYAESTIGGSPISPSDPPFPSGLAQIPHAPSSSPADGDAIV